jgi:hypothetical protein
VKKFIVGYLLGNGLPGVDAGVISGP